MLPRTEVHAFERAANGGFRAETSAGPIELRTQVVDCAGAEAGDVAGARRRAVAVERLAD